MSEKVNAEADIEKELAERLQALRTALQALWLEVPADVAREFSRVAHCYIETSRAALLAEAGERAKLEAERDEARANADFLRRSIGECHLMISRNTPEFQIEHDWQPTDLPPRLQTIMRRARGLEAQLETVTGLLRRFRDKLKIILPIVDSTVTLQFARTGTRYIGPNLAEEMNEADAALSQLPTPAQEKK